MASKKARVKAALELANSDTARIKRLTKRKEDATNNSERLYNTWLAKPPGSDPGRVLNEKLEDAWEEEDDSGTDLENAPFNMTKLINAAVLKHGPPKKRLKKLGK